MLELVSLWRSFCHFGLGGKTSFRSIMYINEVNSLSWAFLADLLLARKLENLSSCMCLSVCSTEIATRLLFHVLQRWLVLALFFFKRIILETCIAVFSTDFQPLRQL